MQYNKRLNDIDTQCVENIRAELGVSFLLAKLLYSRGITDVPAAKKYLYGKITDLTSPYVFQDMEKAVDRIKKAFQSNEKILIYGDYDCDGVGAISILHLSFKDNGIESYHYIPVRAKEGYGLNAAAVQEIKKTIDPDLIITVDCGINSVEEVELIKALDMDVIVTDHHQPGRVLPDCLVINPCLTQNASPLCGAGVAFTLVRALFGDEQALKYIDICALSTVADIVPLVDDNRLIVKYGMALIRKGKCRKGIKELLYIAKTDFHSISTSDIGYKIAPRINAAGRLSNAEISFRLLTSDDPTELHLLADDLNSLNVERQSMNNSIFEEAISLLKKYDFSQNKIIMLKGDWNEGVVGIVCAKLVEYFNLPTILLCKQEGTDVLKGSARSISGINLFEMFDRNNEKLVSYGGHEMAAGISFKEEDFDAVLETFNHYIKTNIDNEVFGKKMFYDEILHISEITNVTIAEIDRMEPFGQSNSAPVFLDDAADAQFKQIGKTQHVKARYKIGDLVAFDRLKLSGLLRKGQFSVVYTFDKNYFNGKIYTQFIAKDISINNINLPDTDILENFCRTFMPQHNKNFIVGKATKGNSPTLYVTYSFSTLKDFLKKNRTIKYCIFNQQGCELNDLVVVAPSDDFPYCFYSKIVFLDTIGDNFKKLFINERCNADFYSSKMFLPKLPVEELRAYYSTLKTYCSTTRKYISATKVFEELYTGLTIEKEKKIKFITAFYILRELNLIKINIDGIMYISSEKVSLTQSTLYQYING